MQSVHCPECHEPAVPRVRSEIRFWGCKPCNRAILFPERKGAKKSLTVETTSSPSSPSCIAGHTGVYGLLQWDDHELEGDWCGCCRVFTASLSGMNAFMRGVHQARCNPKNPRDDYNEIEERDRVFAFLFQIPLELSKHISSRPPVITSVMLLCLAAFGLTLLSAGQFAQAWAFPIGPLNLETLPKSLSSIFIHWSPAHLLGNLYFLYAFGRLVEDRLGALGMVVLFLGTGLFADLGYSAASFEPGTLSAGASGAISGILGCYLVLFPRRRVGYSLVFTVLKIPAFIFFGIWFMWQILMADSNSDVAYGAHAAGFFGGLLFGFVIRTNLLGLGNWLIDPGLPRWLQRKG